MFVERVLDLGLGRFRFFFQQAVKFHDDPRGTESALDRAGLGDGFLDRVQLGTFGQFPDQMKD